MAATPDSMIPNEWRDFTVEYGKDGQRIREKTLLTISINPTRQIVVLPKGKTILAEWGAKGPIDYNLLRTVAMNNVAKLRTGKLTQEDLLCF